MSSGVTPWVRPPSVIAKLWETGVRIPIRLASRAMRLTPVWIPSAANTELSENSSALVSVRSPTYVPSKFSGLKSSLPPELGTTNERFFDGHTESGLTPSRSAWASTNALNDDPGWRWPWVARLNCDFS
jgi:hypothetical protein